jgi:hypothetical protein
MTKGHQEEEQAKTYKLWWKCSFYLHLHPCVFKGSIFLLKKERSTIVNPKPQESNDSGYSTATVKVSEGENHND